MIWSQIKLTSYDLTDLHITGEFDNRPGTGRFLKKFSWVSHIVRAPAGVCIWKHRPMLGQAPYGVVRDQPDTIRCLADFTRIFRCNGEFIYIKICHIIKKIEADSDSDDDKKTTLAQDCKIFNSTCSLHVNSPQLLKQVFMFLVFRSEISM